MKRAVKARRWFLLSIGLVLLLALGGGGQSIAAATSFAVLLSGSSNLGTRLDNIEVLSWSHQVITAREAGSGIATGRRQYQPLLIRKRIDKASPLLMRAMGRGEVFGSLTLTINDQVAGGKSSPMTITLTNAQVVKIATGGRDDDCDGVMDECVSFVASKISWSADGVTYEDNWLSPEQSAPSYFMAINEKGLPGRAKKQTKASAYRIQITSAPREAGSGMASGRRQHSPFILVMPDSSQTSELTSAFLTGKHLERVSLITYGPDGVATGAVSLVDVQIVAMTETHGDPHVLEAGRTGGGDNPLFEGSGGTTVNPLYNSALARSGQDCVYQLIYQKIEWLDATGGVTHEDTWDSQR